MADRLACEVKEQMVIGISDVIWISLIALAFFLNDVRIFFLAISIGITLKVLCYLWLDYLERNPD